MELLFVGFVLAIAVGIWASKRGRSGVGWFLLSILISPLLAALLLVALRNLAIEHSEQERIAHTKTVPAMRRASPARSACLQILWI
jgi:hypothetical protein